MKLLFLFCFKFLAVDALDMHGSIEPFLSVHSIAVHPVDSNETAPNDRWVYFFNNKIEYIDSVYLPNALIVLTNGTMYRRPKERLDFYAYLKNSIGKIKSITTLNRTDLTPDLSLEIGFFITSGNVKYKHLVIWKKVKGRWLRELEVINESKNETPDIATINLARNQWMDLCNRHKVNELVSSLYVENAVYYNNARVISGTEGITKEYRYMNNPTYQLTLTPLVLEPVNENVVFEIGQCSGSYQGKYTLVWGRKNGVWKILFDSN